MTEYRMMPVEPTEEMVRAMHEAWLDRANVYEIASVMTTMYRAAIAASPVVEATPVADHDAEVFDRELARRDHYHAVADELAWSIGNHLGIEIGEHSSLNDPWANALNAMREAATILGFATPSNWRVVRHPDFELIDEVRIRTRERWKESELSGDEWRFSMAAECLHKGHVLASQSFGGRMEWALLGIGGLSLKAGDSGVPNEIFDLEKIVCAQPGCCNPASVFYRVRALYDNAGHKEELPRSHDSPGTVYVIRFCDRHRHRGDCGLQDSDANYEELSLVSEAQS